MDRPGFHNGDQRDGLGDRHTPPEPAATERPQPAEGQGHGFLDRGHRHRPGGPTADRVSFGTGQPQDRPGGERDGPDLPGGGHGNSNATAAAALGKPTGLQRTCIWRNWIDFEYNVL